MRKIFTLFALTSFFVAGVAFAYTSPGTPSGYVNDFAGLLNQEEKTTLEATLKDFHETQGGEIAVVTIPSLGGDAIEDYANALFREWGIGTKDKNNGALLLIAKEDRKLRIEVGYGYEGSLTDARSSEIIRNTITPYFKQEAYGLGIMSGARDIITTITTGEVPTAAKQSSSNPFKNFDPFTVLFFGYIIITWLASIFGRSKSWWAGGVFGGVVGVIVTFFVASLFVGGALTVLFVVLGLLFDFLVSRGYQSSVANKTSPPWWTGGGMGGHSSGGGGFGGFSGGSSGGGGSSGSW